MSAQETFTDMQLGERLAKDEGYVRETATFQQPRGTARQLAATHLKLVPRPFM